jgi:hypothetical protein
MTCCNNPRGVRYLTEETFLIMVIPGPNEPTLEQLNKIMDRFISEMIQLYSGMCCSKQQVIVSDYALGHDFRVHGHENKFPVHSVLNTEVSDLPASRKLEGLASFSSKNFMCPQCETPSYHLADPRCFDAEGK